jgi:hypothetical protein
METQDMPQDEAPLQRFLRKREAKLMFACEADSSWYKLISDGVIPPGVKTSASRFAPALWLESELLAAQ